MRDWPRFAASLLLLALPLRGSAAQQIRGVVSDSAAGTPVSGAVVMLLDASGAALARTISNQSGDYALSAAGTPVTLRIRRLGFRPRDIALTTPLPSRLDLRISRVPTLLQPVRVAVAPNCPKRADREAAYALLEQARAGLLTTVVARSMAPAASMTRLAFRRWMDGTSDRADSMTVSFDSVGRTPGSYGAVRSAREFLRDGFMFEFGDTVHYLAPDADVLLDERFGQGYCFHLRRDASRTNQLGLAFVPARRVRDRVDVDGTLWLDTLARELRDIEFKYLGLAPGTGAANPGGRIGFWAMPNGLVFIDSWHLRLPRLGAETTYTANSGGRPLVREWIEATEGGGEVARAMWADSTTFAGSLGTVHGRAVDLEGKGVSNVVIRLRGTDYVTSPGVAGFFEINQLVPGPYIADIVDPSIAHLGITLPTALRFEARRDSVSEVRMLVPNTAEQVVMNCDGRSWPPPYAKPSLLQIKVTTGGKPASNVAWEIRKQVGADWQYVAERRRTGEDGIVYTCLRYAEDDVVEVRIFPPDGKTQYIKLTIDRYGNRIEAKVPPAAPKPPFRPSAERLRSCARDTVGEPCASSP